MWGLTTSVFEINVLLDYVLRYRIGERAEYFAAAKVNKIFSGYQPRQMVRNVRRFRDRLCHHQDVISPDSEDGDTLSLMSSNSDDGERNCP
jgi:hypothetical protein